MEEQLDLEFTITLEQWQSTPDVCIDEVFRNITLNSIEDAKRMLQRDTQRNSETGGNNSFIKYYKNKDIEDGTYTISLDCYSYIEDSLYDVDVLSDWALNLMHDKPLSVRITKKNTDCILTLKEQKQLKKLLRLMK